MEKCQPVLLQPFMHQVGGHSHMFVYDSSTVCKPLCDRECKFYSTLPKRLLQFTPAFKGVIEVEAHEDRDGDISLISLPQCLRKTSSKTFNEAGCSPGSSGEGGNDDSDSDSGCSTACGHSSSVDKPARSYKKSSKADLSSGSTILFENHSGKLKPVSAGSRNPWSIRCHSRRLDEIRCADKKYKGRKFILLENVVSKFHRPCVLDLKMGTRQYGDDDDDEKRERKKGRCITTTSAKLGIRMCGMQVYQIRSGKFICRDKYYGRKLTEEGLHDILCQFLHNGVRLRVELIDHIIERLQLLHSVVFKLNSFRFYSSSLLVMYDGALGRDDGHRDRDGDDNDVDDDDDDIACDATLPPEKDARLASVDRDRAHGGEIVEALCATMDESPATASCSRDESSRAVQRVDVRWIDFAHSTSDVLQSDRAKYHQGPDTGFLIGLENLMRMFGELKLQEIGP